MITARLLPKYPKRINVSGGLTKTEANGVVTLGFDYATSEFGAELQQAVDATAADATATAADRTAVAADLAAANEAAAVASGAISVFATETAALAFNPTAASSYIKTFGASAVADGGGQLYKNNGTTTGDLAITLSDGTTHVGYDAAGQVISAAAFGLASSASAATNLAAIKSAAARVPIGGTLYIPDMGGTCTVDTSGGLTGAIQITNQITVQIDAHLKANYAANEANPSYMFKITADGVVFTGIGTIEGNGFNNIDSAGGDDSIYPGLIYVAADHFDFSGIRILYPPKIGINLRACNYARIHGSLFEGGVATYDIEGGRYLVGITASGGQGHEFSGLQFLPGSDSGKLTQCIFSGGNSGPAQQLRIIGNYAFAWEKLCYLFGQGHVVSNNIVQGPTLTDAIRIWDNDSIVEGNITFDCFGGVQVLDCNRVKVVNNQFLRCSSFGVYVTDTDTAYNPGVIPTLIDVSGNTITWDGTTTDRQFGVSVYSSIGDTYYCKVHDNTISGFGVGPNGADYFYAIDVQTISPYNTYNASIRRNTIIGHDRGIRAGRLSGGAIKDNDLISGSVLGILVSGGSKLEVCGNRGDDPGAIFITIDAAAKCSNSRFLNNKCTGATTIGIPNLLASDNNFGEGNIYNGAPLVGAITMPALASKTVSHGGVAPNALIFLQAANTTAATFSGGFYCSPSGNDFAIATGSGSAAAGTEVLNYKIVQ